MKNEFLEKLRSDETYQRALKMARSDEERTKISTAAESMFDLFQELFSKFDDLKNDPEKMKEVIELFKSISADGS